MTTESRHFSYDALELAEEFYEAFRQLPATGPRGISWPRYFLLCHAIELALKSFLAWHGAAAEDLQKRFRHKIEPLMTEAVSKDLSIGKLAATEIMQLDEAHAKHWPRYPHKEMKPIFVIDPFEPYVVELLRSVSTTIRGSGVSAPFVRY
jgi:hypothetical protein